MIWSRRLLSFSLLCCLFLGSLTLPLSANGKTSSLEILRSEEFQTCQKKLKEYVEANDDLSEKLGRCKVEAKEEKILWIIPAKDVGNIAIGILIGAVLL